MQAATFLRERNGFVGLDRSGDKVNTKTNAFGDVGRFELLFATPETLKSRGFVVL
jgi:hypothetical protein